MEAVKGSKGPFHFPPSEKDGFGKEWTEGKLGFVYGERFLWDPEGVLWRAIL